jgi:hypothetical protein
MEIKLVSPWSPLTVSLANVIWEPSDPLLFSDEQGIEQPNGTVDEPAVRAELETRLRARAMFSDEQIVGVLAQYDSEQAKKKIPHARVRAGLLMLWGTSAEFAIEFILADTNRRGVPFEPAEVRDLGGAYAGVSYHPLEGKMRLFIDSTVARDTLEGIAVALAHEAVHSDLGGGSVTEEVLAMASDTRVYEEFLLTDPSLALVPTELTRVANRLVLAMRNSGRFGFPRAGLLARPGVDDVLRGTADFAARSFQEMLAKPDWYGDYNPKAGDAGTEVLEAYYARLSGNRGDQGRLKHDQHTLKLFDTVIDNGMTDEQIWTIVDALKLRPIKLR